MCDSIRKPDDVHAELAGGGDVLSGDVGLGAVGRDADRPDAEVVGVLEVVDRADAGQQQGGQGGASWMTEAAASIHSQSECDPGP